MHDYPPVPVGWLTICDYAEHHKLDVVEVEAARARGDLPARLHLLFTREGIYPEDVHVWIIPTHVKPPAYLQPGAAPAEPSEHTWVLTKPPKGFLFASQYAEKIGKLRQRVDYWVKMNYIPHVKYHKRTCIREDQIPPVFCNHGQQGQRCVNEAEVWAGWER